MNKSSIEASEGSFNRIAPPMGTSSLNGEGSVEPQELSRFEGEGGPEAPSPDVVDITYANAVWQKPR